MSPRLVVRQRKQEARGDLGRIKNQRWRFHSSVVNDVRPAIVSRIVREAQALASPGARPMERVVRETGLLGLVALVTWVSVTQWISSELVTPRLVMGKDRALTLDARTAKPVRVTAPDARARLRSAQMLTRLRGRLRVTHCATETSRSR